MSEKEGAQTPELSLLLTVARLLRAHFRDAGYPWSKDDVALITEALKPWESVVHALHPNGDRAARPILTKEQIAKLFPAPEDQPAPVAAGGEGDEAGRVLPQATRQSGGSRPLSIHPQDGASPSSLSTAGLEGCELLPCPFCGGEAEFEQTDGYLGAVRWSVGCKENDGKSDLCMGYQSLTSFATKREAATAWNRRSSPPAVAGLEWRTFNLDGFVPFTVHATSRDMAIIVEVFNSLMDTRADCVRKHHELMDLKYPGSRPIGDAGKAVEVVKEAREYLKGPIMPATGRELIDTLAKALEEAEREKDRWKLQSDDWQKLGWELGEKLEAAEQRAGKMEAGLQAMRSALDDAYTFITQPLRMRAKDREFQLLPTATYDSTKFNELTEKLRAALSGTPSP